MSAAQPKAPEPSMEEILASIRRIISDEPAKVAAVPAPAPAPVARDDDDEILDLTPKARVKPVEPHYIADDPVENDLSFEDIAPKAPPKSQEDIDALMDFAAEPPPAPVEPPAIPVMIAPPIAQAAPPSLGPSLLAPETDRAASSAFSSLATTILSKNARTLEDLMQEMMRPMVKTWLDDNLPSVVERLVKAEIERVSRGGR